MNDKTVTALNHQDYVDWHKHRPHFCLWYIEIDDKDILQYCQIKQAEFAQFLVPNYQRPFHITLFVNGFWQNSKVYDDDFIQNNLDRQVATLQSLNLKPFALNLTHLHSFDNCLSIKIADNDNLTLIRKHLKTTHHEISPSVYLPHITLGFYRQNFLKKTILNEIDNKGFENVSFNVHKLTFGYYHAVELQGNLTPIFEITL